MRHARRQGDELARRASPRGEVLAGVFAGLRLPLDSSWGGLGARIAGTYEQELADAITAIIDRRPARVIDVGAAEGYYAVGLARALPDSTVYAFDLDPEQRRLCRSTARLNGTENVKVRGRIDPARLSRLIVPGTVVLADCEGYEDELLDPTLAPTLAGASILVELHEFAVPGVTERVLGRFADTHSVVMFDATGRERPAHLQHLPAADVDLLIGEGRPTEPWPMQWAFLTPR